jgi:hypothetical protein
MLQFPTVFSQKLAKPSLLIVLFPLLAFSAPAANWYTTPSGAGSKTGTNWNNAWSCTNITWSSLSAGDTVWFAGGYYSYGDSSGAMFIVNQSGTAANRIYLNRATTNDYACTNVAGWLPSYGTNIVMYGGNATMIQWAPAGFIGSYVTIDGRTTRGWTLIVNTNSGSDGISIGEAGSSNQGGGVTNVVFANLDVIGLNYFTSPTDCTQVPQSARGTGIFIYPGYSAGRSVVNTVFTNCYIHGHTQGFFTYADNKYVVSGVTFDHCQIYNNGANTTNHLEIFYLTMDGPLVIRYCNIWDWSSEGIWVFYTNQFPFYIYGNVFHDKGPHADANGIEDCSSTVQGVGGAMHYVVNNTIYNLSGATWYGKTNNAFLNKNSLFENNLFISCKQEYKTDNPSQKPPGTWDYNYANNNILNVYGMSVDQHSLNNTRINPLVSPGVGGNFMIVSNIGALYPRNKGVVITNVVDPLLGIIDFSKDPNGNTRGADGAWDIGAYEYVSGVVVEPIISNIYSIPIPLSTNSVTIAWTTDENANSIVDYGITTSYGSSITNSSMVTFHEITITNLNTQISTYFQIRSIDSQNRMNFRTDNIPTSQSFL